MKDFTTADYIKPIVDEISRKYYIDRPTKEVKAIFKCDLELSPASGSNDIYFINSDRDTLLPDIYKFLYVFQEITLFSKAVETYPGELDQWQDREKDRVIKATYNELIKQYNR